MCVGAPGRIREVGSETTHARQLGGGGLDAIALADRRGQTVDAGEDAGLVAGVESDQLAGDAVDRHLGFDGRSVLADTPRGRHLTMVGRGMLRRRVVLGRSWRQQGPNAFKQVGFVAVGGGTGLRRLDQLAQPGDRRQQGVADGRLGDDPAFTDGIQQLLGDVRQALDAIQAHESGASFDRV